MGLGRKIAELRKQNNLSQQDFGKQHCLLVGNQYLLGYLSKALLKITKKIITMQSLYLLVRANLISSLSLC